jgi:predicted transcriptional regulator
MLSMGLTRLEKEKLVLELYNEGKTYHQIAKVARISLRDIGPILNKAGIQQTLSDSSRAYTLFDEGKSPIQVAIALNLREKDVTEYYREYWKLNGLRYLNQIYEEIKEDLWSVLKLYRQVKAENMDEKHVIGLLKIANNDIPSVESRCQELKREEAGLKAGNQQAARTFQKFNDLISKENKTLERYRSIYNQIKEETENLNTKKIRLENIIDSFQNNNETYIKIKQMIKQEIECILLNPRRLLQFAIVSVFESSRKHPGKLHPMYYNMPTMTTKGLKSEMAINQDAADYNTCENLLLDEAEQLYNRMIEECMTICSNEMANNSESSSPRSLQPLGELSEAHHGKAQEKDNGQLSPGAS